MIKTLKERLLETYRTSSDYYEFVKIVFPELRKVIKDLAKRTSLKSRVNNFQSQYVRELDNIKKLIFVVKGKLIFNKHAYIEVGVQVFVKDDSPHLKLFLILWLYNHKNSSFHPESCFDCLLAEDSDFENVVEKVESWKTSKILPYLFASL